MIERLSLLNVLFLFLFLGTNTAQNPSYNEPIPLDPSIRVGKLKNGFTYYLKKVSGATIDCRFEVKAGFNQEESREMGFAHVIEHMPFSGTKHFANARSSFTELGLKEGGFIFGAQTSDKKTSYEAVLPTGNEELLRKIILFYRDCAHDINMDSAHIEMERSAVLEEMRLASGTHLTDIINQYLKFGQYDTTKYYNAERENVARFKYSALTSFYNKWYRPNFQAIIIVGEFDLQKTESLVRSLFSDLKPSDVKLGLRKDQNSLDRVQSNIFSTIIHKEVREPIISMYYKGDHKIRRGLNDLQYEVSALLFNTMINERLRDLVKSSSSQKLKTSGEYLIGYNASGSIIDVVNFNIYFEDMSPEDAVALIIKYVEQIRQWGFLENELAFAKDKLGSDLQFYNSANQVMVDALSEHFFDGKVPIYRTVHKNLLDSIMQNININYLNNLVAKWLTINNNLNVFLLKRVSDSAISLNQDQVCSIMKKVSSGKVDRYVMPNKKKKSEKIELISQAEVHGLQKDLKYFTRERYNSEITKITLQNGIEVYFKRLPNQVGEVARTILKSIIIENCQSNNLLLDKEAHYIVSKSGLNTLDADALSEFYEQNGVDNLYPYSSDGQFGFSASCKSESLEKVLQAIYLYSVKPNVDSLQVSRRIKTIRFDNSHVTRSPSEIILDTINYFRTGRSLSSVCYSCDLNDFSSKNIKNHFFDRFSSTINAKYYFVGSFDEAEFTGLVLRYLGSIPKKEFVRLTNCAGNNATKPSIPSHEVIIKGMAKDLSHIRLSLNGFFEYSRVNKIKLLILEKYLVIKLRERLRNQERGTYRLSLSLTMREEKTSTFWLDVSFSCAPANTNRLIASAKDELEEVKTSDINSDTFNTLKVSLRNRIEREMYSPDFWIDYMSSQAFACIPFVDVAKDIELLNQINSTDIRIFADKIFKVDQISSYIEEGIQ